MKTIIYLFLLTFVSTASIPQDWYQTVGPTNTLSCTLTNFAGPPAFYSIYWVSTNETKRFNTVSVPIAFSNFWSGIPSGIYSVQMTATTTNGMETLRSTNAYYYYNPPPVVPGGPVGLIVR